MQRALDPLTQAVWHMTFSLWPLWAAIGGLLLIRIVIVIYQARRLARAGMAEIDHMDGITFERYLVSLFRRHGYTVQHTPARGDFGADLIISKNGVRTAVQAKRYAKNVGVKAIQEVVTAQKMYTCAKAMVVTNSTYTQPAQQLARANNVDLWDRRHLVKVILAPQQKKHT
jgi:restriction system protein